MRYSVALTPGFSADLSRTDQGQGQHRSPALHAAAQPSPGGGTLSTGAPGWPASARPSRLSMSTGPAPHHAPAQAAGRYSSGEGSRAGPGAHAGSSGSPRSPQASSGSSTSSASHGGGRGDESSATSGGSAGAGGGSPACSAGPLPAGWASPAGTPGGGLRLGQEASTRRPLLSPPMQLPHPGCGRLVAARASNPRNARQARAKCSCKATLPTPFRPPAPPHPTPSAGSSAHSPSVTSATSSSDTSSDAYAHSPAFPLLQGGGASHSCGAAVARLWAGQGRRVRGWAVQPGNDRALGKLASHGYGDRTVARH